MKKREQMAKLRKCKAHGCRATFAPINSFHRACSPACAIKLARKKRKVAEAEQRKKDKLTKDALRPYSYWVKKAQAACNSFVRLRDAGQPCISCGRNTGCKMNAGHYMSAGSSKSIRFHPWNINLQCEHCNSYLSGNESGYTEGLTVKIGQENVEWLKNNRNGYTPTVEEVKEIEAHYKELTKEWQAKNE